jgi:hypothetical protein
MFVECKGHLTTKLDFCPLIDAIQGCQVLLTGHSTLRRHLHLMWLSDSTLCRKCGTEDETSTSLEAPHYTRFSVHIVFFPDIFHSTILFKHSSRYVLPSTCGTKFHTHMKLRGKIVVMRIVVFVCVCVCVRARARIRVDNVSVCKRYISNGDVNCADTSTGDGCNVA